jgi:hypothetical protein
LHSKRVFYLGLAEPSLLERGKEQIKK